MGKKIPTLRRVLLSMPRLLTFCEKKLGPAFRLLSVSPDPTTDACEKLVYFALFPSARLDDHFQGER